MSLEAIVLVIMSTVLINNYCLTKFLGMCSFIGVSKQLDSAIGMGLSVTFVMTIASLLTWVVYDLLLVPYEITYLSTLAFMLIIASLVQFVELVVRKVSPPLYKSLGIYLPLITSNCAVLAAPALAVQKQYDCLMTTIYGFGAGVGFSLALILMAGLRERLEDCNVPRVLRGAPIGFITASLISLAFMGFAGMIKE